MRSKVYMLELVFYYLAVPALADHHHAHTPEVSTSPPVFNDLGTHHHAITTTSPEAQQYCDLRKPHVILRGELPVGLSHEIFRSSPQRLHILKKLPIVIGQN